MSIDSQMNSMDDDYNDIEVEDGWWLINNNKYQLVTWFLVSLFFWVLIVAVWNECTYKWVSIKTYCIWN